MLRETRKFDEAASQAHAFGFGFLNRHVGTFRGKEDLLGQAADFNPLEVPINDRMKEQFCITEDQFDPERYAYDNFEDEQVEAINEIISLEPPKVEVTGMIETAMGML